MHKGGQIRSLRASAMPPAPPPSRLQSRQPGSSVEESLLDLASNMESDGGMPGADSESRACSTDIALLAFLAQGHILTSGAFRSHVARLVKFLKSLSGLSPSHQQLIASIIENAEKGQTPAGDWLKLARSPGNHWDALARS